MSADEFDLRLSHAARSLVSEPLALEVVDAGAVLRPGRQPGFARAGLTAVAFLALVGLVGAVAVIAPRLGTAGPGSAQKAISAVAPSISVDSLPTGVPVVSTSDGHAYVVRADGSILLMLRQPDGSNLVLASIAETRPRPTDAFVSVHFAECPPSTGLDQRYYAFGQANHASGTFSYSGITGKGALRDDLYLVAITSDPTGHEWTYNVGGPGGGASAVTFDQLPSYAEVSPAGCIFDPK